MNILIPDSWLREHLRTKATPKELKDYLSLSGPSVERINKEGKETIYDIEVTGNRPDSMSVVGIAREASVILPRFGLKTALIDDPYTMNAKKESELYKKEGSKKISITTDPALNPRFTAIVLEEVTIKPSPTKMKKRLEMVGVRAINNVVDITNYIMHWYGQPVHAFDFDQIHKTNDTVTMIVRASKKGEKLVTLDGKTHMLPGDDIVIEDGSGKLIDLCGIMGGENSSISENTKTVILFMQTYDAMHIRKTSMRLAHRTEAAGLFEKTLDPELVLPAMLQGITLMTENTGGKVASKLYDVYPQPYKPYTVNATRAKVDTYLGTHVPDKELAQTLTPLGFVPTITDETISVKVPSYRRDVTIDVDVIEEIARIYGYQNIKKALPSTEPPIVIPDPNLTHEHDIKIRLRGWGFTETYTYSMISEEQMNLFDLPKAKTYTIANPLSTEWVYMRPTLLPSMLAAVEQNLHFRDSVSLFELSMTYRWREGELPHERPTLIVVRAGEQFTEIKGVAEAVFTVMGIPFPKETKPSDSPYYKEGASLTLGSYGSIGLIKPTLLDALTIKKAVTVLELDFEKLAADAHPTNTYIPIAKYPPIIEDISFVVPDAFHVGPLLDTLTHAHKLVQSVVLLDIYEDKRTVRVAYSDPERTLTNEIIAPVREKLINVAQEKFGLTVQTS